MFAKNKVTQSMLDAVNSVLNEDKKLLLEPEPENTAKDKKKDLEGEKETGMTHAQYEKSARDKKEDMKEGKDCVTEPEAKNIADKEVSKHEKNMHKGKKSNIKESSFIRRLLSQVNEDRASAKNLETFTDNNMGENKKLIGKQTELDKNKNGHLDKQDFEMLRKEKDKLNKEEVEELDEVKERGLLRDVAPRLSGLVPKHKLKPNEDKKRERQPSPVKKETNEAVETSPDKNAGKITTDTLAGRVASGKLNSFKSFKTNLTTSGTQSIPSEIEHGENTKEKQKISTNPGPVDINLDDKLTGPTPYTHFSDEKSITNEKVEPELRKKHKESEEENEKQKRTFSSKVVEDKKSPLEEIKTIAKHAFKKVKSQTMEEVEALDESDMLDQYLNSLGINPRTLTRNKKVSYAKSNAFITWKNNHQHLR